MENAFENTIDVQENTATEEKVAEVRKKIGEFKKKMGFLESNEKLMELIRDLKSKYSNEELDRYMIMHIVGGSSSNYQRSPKWDLLGDDSIEKFLDEQIAKSEIEKEK